ncbi:restriction endonuclease subunit S [Spongiibacter marinus]|uniref:restriction endonuclease subunit S n=1 Tax=Spongiibacter marinus TaxID=354246 RepID=UPI0035BE5834
MAKLAQKVAEGAARYVTAEAQGAELLLQNLDVWTAATRTKSTRGRGSGGKIELAGIKKLRELILELAVRGRLVPQDPSDESASVLLERIQQEKARLIADGKIKKQKPLPPISEEEKQFAIPSTWMWARLAEAYDVRDGTHDSPKYQSEGFPLVTSKNLSSGKLDLSDVKRISSEDHRKFSERSLVANGDILFAMIGTIGNPVIVDTDEEFSIKNVALFKPLSVSTSDMAFLLVALRVIARHLDENSGGGVQKFVSLGALRKQAIAIPPLAEQSRIVAKVDELMALCDQLEQQTEQQLDAHQQLVETLLGTLTQSQSADDLAANWQRLAEHFDLLFCGPMGEWAVDRLKDTILQLAVMGKLVPQDPSDEPAFVLLERIQQEKARLIAEGKIKKQKPLLPISEEEKPFELPEGWEWTRLGNCSLSSDSGWSPKCDDAPRAGNGWGVLKVSAVTWGAFRADENKALPSSLEPRVGCEVRADDFLISRANTAELVARSVVVPPRPPKRLLMSDKIIRLRFPKDICSEYINLVNNSGGARAYYLSVAGGTSSSMKNVSREQIRSLVVPVPPLREQRCIVSKVEQLMTYCNQLKEMLSLIAETRCSLTEVLSNGAFS